MPYENLQNINISGVASDYAKSTEGAKIIPGIPTEKINSEIRLKTNFVYGSIQHNLEFIEKFTLGLMPPRWAFKLATTLHNKKIFYKSIYEKYPLYKSYRALKLVLLNRLKESQPNGKYSPGYGDAGKLAEECLAFFAGMNVRRPISPTGHILNPSTWWQKPDFRDSHRTYEFKLCPGKDSIQFQYKKAYVQANLSYYLTNEGIVKSDKDIIILEFFVLSEDIIYRYHLKPDLVVAKAAIEYKALKVKQAPFSIQKPLSK